MSLRDIYSLFFYVYMFLLILLYIECILSSHASGIITKAFIKNLGEKSADEGISGHELAFISVYNTILLCAWLFLKMDFIITIGFPIGALLYSLSLIGDISELFFSDETSGKVISKQVDVVTLRSMAMLVLASVISTNEFRRHYSKEIDECTDTRALVEIVILVFIIYVYISIFFKCVYIIYGCLCICSNVDLDEKIVRHRGEVKNLKKNIVLFSEKMDSRHVSMSWFSKIFFFLPEMILGASIYFLNYFRQLIRNIRIFFLMLFRKCINNGKKSLQNKAFSLFRNRVTQISIILSILIVYIWLALFVGPEIVVTRIVYFMATIVIIPISINIMTGVV